MKVLNKNNGDKIYGRVKLLTALISLAAMIILLFIFWSYNNYFPAEMGNKQPIPFSHRLHAGKKHISCFMCHEGAIKNARAGIPPLETCMLCHSNIIIHYPYIKKLRQHYFQNNPVKWVKIIQLPDFVYFNHSVHINKGIDCSKCHGNVDQMDRIVEAKELTMGFCITCHKQNNATHDCFTCHR